MEVVKEGLLDPWRPLEVDIILSNPVNTGEHWGPRPSGLAPPPFSHLGLPPFAHSTAGLSNPLRLYSLWGYPSQTHVMG